MQFRRTVADLTIAYEYVALRPVGERQLVRHHDDGRACFVNIVEQVQDAVSHLRIEITGWLIRKQEPRLAC